LGGPPVRAALSWPFHGLPGRWFAKKVGLVVLGDEFPHKAPDLSAGRGIGGPAGRRKGIPERFRHPARKSNLGIHSITPYVVMLLYSIFTYL